MYRRVIVYSFVMLQLLIASDWAYAWTISINGQEMKESVDVLVEDDAIDPCGSTENINLSGTGLTIVPDRLVDSSCVRSIFLDDNSIETLQPTAFERARNLQCVNLARNKIPFDKLLSIQQDSLRTLNVSYQQWGSVDFGPVEFIDPWRKTVTIPSSISTRNSKLPNLEHLDLSGIEFIKFPDNFNQTYPKLTHLYLNDRSVVEIEPEFFFAMPSSLRSLHVQRNRLEVMNVSYLGNIEAMYLDSNWLGNDGVRLNSYIMETLSLSNCGISRVNVTLLSGMPNLRNLDLSSNSIQQLDQDAFQHARHLEALSLSRNEFNTFPYLRSLQQLKRLSLSYNAIVDISYAIQMPSLKKLNLRGNRITTITASAFSQLTALEQLDLAENELTSLHSAWSGASIIGLRYLDLGFNKLARIADTWVHDLTDLTKLFIEGNHIKTIDESEFKYLPQMCTVYMI